MLHFGDITKLNGAELPIVDCITGGSPCQDLSVAGGRAGLGGERSGLFMEQIRIVKEMREHDRSNGRTAFLIRPRYMVWENVPGAFSSNKGKDFQAVLTEIVRIVEPESPDVPLPNKGGWSKSGCLYDELGRWSIAWRVHDAQFWGVPQRRKRIALVADFGGLSAPEILFVRKGLCWDSESSGAERQGTPARTESGVGESMSFQERAGKPGGGKGILIQNEKTASIRTQNNQSVIALEGNGSRESHNGDGYRETETMYTLNTIEQHAVMSSGGTYRKTAHPRNSEEAQGYESTDTSDTLNVFDNTEARTPTLVVGESTCTRKNENNSSE